MYLAHRSSTVAFADHVPWKSERNLDKAKPITINLAECDPATHAFQGRIPAGMPICGPDSSGYYGAYVNGDADFGEGADHVGFLAGDLFIPDGITASSTNRYLPASLVENVDVVEAIIPRHTNTSTPYDGTAVMDSTLKAVMVGRGVTFW